MNNLIAALVWCCAAAPVSASEMNLEKFEPDTSMLAVERGIDTFMNICHGCHSLKQVHYRDLAGLGISKDKIASWRGDSTLDAAMTGMLADDAAMQSFGAIPPDLSVMVNAREGGARYLYFYLTGYYHSADGQTGNHVFPLTKMPDPLGISEATDPSQRLALQGKAHDIVSFLAWAADPHEAERRTLGYYVIGYLIVLTILLYGLKRQVWSRLKA